MGEGYREDGNLEKASLVLSGGLNAGNVAQEAWASDRKRMTGMGWEVGWGSLWLRSRRMDPLPKRKDFPGNIPPPGRKAGKPNCFFLLLELGP